MRYEVTTPDGRRFEIEAPEGVSPDALSREVETAIGRPAAAPPQPIGVGERMLYGAGDVARGVEQIAAERMRPPEQTAIGRALMSNPNLRAVMERGAAAVPLPTAEGAREAVRAREEAYEARRAAGGDTGFDWARMAGGIVPAALATAALRAPVTLPGAAAQGGILGAAQGAAMPALGDPEIPERERAALSGAAFGLLGGAAGYGMGRAIAPRVAPEVRTLREAGVELTPGQVLGGAARSAEETLSGAPAVGGAIQRAQQRATESFNTAVANRVLAPLNITVPEDIKVGRDLVDYVSTAVSDAYKNLSRQISPFRLDQGFLNDVTSISGQFLTTDAEKKLARALSRDILSRVQNAGNRIDGDTFLDISETLGRNARNYLGSSSTEDRELGNAFAAVRSAFDDLLARSNPNLADQVSATRQAYRSLVPLQGAAGSARQTAGVFNPAQFSAAIEAADTSVRNTSFARGRANMQDLADASVLRMLPPQTPSTLSDRLAAATLGGAAVGGASLSPEVLMALSGAALGASGAYSRPVSRALTAAVTAERPAFIRELGDLIARSGGAVSVPLNTMQSIPPPEERRGLLD